MAKNYPPFSVLMSVYKNEKPSYLDKALESIENQSVRPSEIVLVEDGPIPAELKNIIIKHQSKMGKMFKDIESKKNQGLGASLRLGTNYVSTNWIARKEKIISKSDADYLKVKILINSFLRYYRHQARDTFNNEEKKELYEIKKLLKKKILEE